MTSVSPELRAKALGSSVMLECPCGAHDAPKPVSERRARKQKLVRVRCRRCGLTSKGARLDRVAIAWNSAVLQRREEGI
jgi:hypothetical protein